MEGRSVLSDADRLARRAIEEYNKYRSPESTAELVEVRGDLIKVRFRGSFTETCGINDWVEDFIYVLEDLGVKAGLVEIEEPEDPLELGTERIATFKLKGARS